VRTDQIEKVRKDPARIDAVARVRLQQVSDERFDRLSRIALEVVGADAAFVSLVDEDADHYIGAAGFPEPLASTRRLEGETFCHFTLVSDGVLLIEDARVHPVLSKVPTVQSLGVVAYAGVPLRASDGHLLGAFCVVDIKPRQWSDSEVSLLIALARVTLDSMRADGSEPDSSATRAEFEHFYDEVGPVLYALFLRILGDSAAASSLLRTFLARRWESVSDGHWRSAQVQARIICDGRDAALQLRITSERQPADAAAVTRALPGNLTERERRILSLAYFDGLSVERIAASTSSDPASVRHELADAMRKMRARGSVPSN